MTDAPTVPSCLELYLMRVGHHRDAHDTLASQYQGAIGTWIGNCIDYMTEHGTAALNQAPYGHSCTIPDGYMDLLKYALGVQHDAELSAIICSHIDERKADHPELDQVQLVQKCDGPHRWLGFSPDSSQRDELPLG